jgi:[acyl-carrier-protein] S-malonyltransferase
MSTAIIFPGQGSQFIGMGEELAQRFTQAAETMALADEILGRPLEEIITNGPKDRLDDTLNAQPAIFVVNYMYYSFWKSLNRPTDYFLGHSLGELSACAAAGVFPFAVGLKIVDRRARLMAAAAAERPGGMLAVLGLDEETVVEVSEAAGIEVANFNSPGQIVVAGDNDKLAAAEAAFKDAGAKRVVKLSVSGPFHTSAMSGAADSFAEFLRPIEFKDPVAPVVSNVYGRGVTSGNVIKELLVKQIVSPVRWAGSIIWLVEEGVDTLIEVGPGKVLTGLTKRISDKISMRHVDDLPTAAAGSNDA